MNPLNLATAFQQRASSLERDARVVPNPDDAYHMHALAKAWFEAGKQAEQAAVLVEEARELVKAFSGWFEDHRLLLQDHVSTDEYRSLVRYSEQAHRLLKQLEATP